MNKKVDLLELSNPQKTKFLKQVRAYLQQHAVEERYYRSISLSSLGKYNVRLKFNVANRFSDLWLLGAYSIILIMSR
jgi:hypothetical protein